MLNATVLTTGLALACGAMLAFVLFCGRLSPVARRRVELALVVVGTAGYGWGLISMATDGDWLWVAIQPILWIWVAFSVVKERRRKLRAQTRQPGTFA